MLLITNRHRNATRMFLERQLAKVVVSELIFTILGLFHCCDKPYLAVLTFT